LVAAEPREARRGRILRGEHPQPTHAAGLCVNQQPKTWPQRSATKIRGTKIGDSGIQLVQW
jgi:hypothetical protein